MSRTSFPAKTRAAEGTVGPVNDGFILAGADWADPAAQDEEGLIPADRAENNPALRNHDIFRALNEARFD